MKTKRLNSLNQKTFIFTERKPGKLDFELYNFFLVNVDFADPVIIL